MPPDDDDHALAARLAAEAGRRLVELRAQVSPSSATLHERWSLRDAGDWSSHVFLVEALARERPNDKVISEEGREDLSRLRAERVWIVDPLDGTREFGEATRTDWAVHVALVMDGAPVAGAVALPALDETWSTHAPPDGPPRRPDGWRPRVFVSRTRPPMAAVLAAEAIGGVLVPMGSAGAKAMAVVRGDGDAYVHAGGQYEWDSAAPVAVAVAAGLHASRIDGSPLIYNKPDPWQPDLLLCRPELAPRIVDALAR